MTASNGHNVRRTISELEPLWSFMAFSCTFPMAASAHSAMEMSRTPEVDDTHVVKLLTECCGGALANKSASLSYLLR